MAGVTTTRTYEDHRNLITAVEHAVDATLISRYTYANNEVGHRTSVVNEGSAFADMGDAMNLYGYNTRGEVTNAVRRWGNNPGSPGDIVAGQTFGYDYDPIGNRTWSKRGDYAREYAANELNQMTSRGVPGVAHLLGSADETATVTVNGQGVTRQDAYWYKDLAVTNDTAPQYPEVVIDAAWSNILSSVTGNVFVAETPEGFIYDDDGNMTSDGRFAYTWDGENRLIAVETLTNVVAASGAPQVRVEYAYDYMSRRIGKTVLNAFTNGAYATTNHTAYLYDGWNLISELTYSETHTLTNFYTWGLDLSGSLQGAGGIRLRANATTAGQVGGLLSATFGGTTSVSSAFFTADANGNIGQLLDLASPTNILAHYEYSPFGETLVAVGDLAKANPFRFSTKYHEDESGLVYYGYRYYKPDMGRWVNRDPIGESGGLNVYVCARNTPVLYIDPLGLETPSTVGQILHAFFMSPRERLWVMPENYIYTQKVKVMQEVLNALEEIKNNIKADCEWWNVTHRSYPSWQPTETPYGMTPPVPYGRREPVDDPFPTSMQPAVDSMLAYLENLAAVLPPSLRVPTQPRVGTITLPNGQVVTVPLSGQHLAGALLFSLGVNVSNADYIPDNLWFATIGRSEIWATVDEIDCNACTAKVNVWMYNAMSRRSFGVWTEFFEEAQMNTQHMLWNWKFDHMWNTD